MKVGFIGCGNMASAIMGGIIEKSIVPADMIYGTDVFAASAEKVKEKYGINVEDDNIGLCRNSDIIVLAVKPQYYSDVIAEIKDYVHEEQIIWTIAPGKSLEWIKEEFGKPVKVVRTMPNTPALIGEGMTAMCYNELVTEEEVESMGTLLSGFGKYEIVKETIMDAVVAVSGSSPAYIFILIEAMADAAVIGGMPREQAYRFASQAVLGSAKMVMDTGKHPAELKDMVCSPAGTTIEAVKILEEKGLRSAIIEAMTACMDKAKRV